MKELIISFSLLITPLNSTTEDIEPKTCYCSDKGIQWTAYCVQQQWSCEKCCDYTKPKEKKDE